MSPNRSIRTIFLVALIASKGSRIGTSQMIQKVKIDILKEVDIHHFIELGILNFVHLLAAAHSENVL